MNNTTTIVTFCKIPSYLHAGEFYRNLDNTDPESIIPIPTDRFHADGNEAANVEEFRQLLRVMTFWMLDSIPLGVLNFCEQQAVDVWEGEIHSLPGDVGVLLLSAYSKADIVPFGDIVKTGRWDLIMHAVDRMDQSDNATRVAAFFGNLNLLKYLHDNDFTWSEDTCWAASQNGHLECLQYAHCKGCPWDAQVYVHAAIYGHHSCMKYAYEEGLEWQTVVCTVAAQAGSLEFLRFAHEHGCPWDNKTTEGAAQEGHVPCLLYALENGCPVDKTACSLACLKGQLECLQLLHQLGVPWDEHASFHAAQGPNTHCLRYLHDHGCPWDKHTSNKAATEGHIDPLRYALEHGCPYDAFIMPNVVRSSNLECLRYLVDERLLCMNEAVFLAALLKGDLTCLQYLLDQGCPFQEAWLDDEAWDIFDIVFRKDNPEFVLCAQFAVDRGWELCENFISYIVTRDAPCKDWLVDEGWYTDETYSDYESETSVISTKRKYDELV